MNNSDLIRVLNLIKEAETYNKRADVYRSSKALRSAKKQLLFLIRQNR